jgi:hypothetical protein
MTEDFVNKLVTNLKEKRELSDVSISTYLRNLKKLNNDQPIKDFKFLKDTKKVLDKLKDYKENTKRNYLISIVGALSVSTKPTEKKLHKVYHDLMINKAVEIKENTNANEMTEKQEKNWISWEQVLKRYDELTKEVKSFVNNKSLTENQYNTMLYWVILSLYTKHKVKRNKDYQLLYIVKQYIPELEKDKNYYDVINKEMIFNNYKTAKTYGQMKEKVSPELVDILNVYLKHHPLYNTKIEKPIPLLVHKDGSPLDKVNSMTRILNKIFDKNIGSSMLRHIILTDKYGKMVEEQKKDAIGMGHSVETQKEYIKKPTKILVSF